MPRHAVFRVAAKLLAGFGAVAVFGTGAPVALGMTFGAWRAIRTQAKLKAPDA